MSEALFALAAVFFLLTIHPYTLYPLSLWMMPRHPLKPPPEGWRRPTVAICMSAYNEEQVIVAKVESLLAMVAAYGPATINIYVDGSADRTAEMLEPYRDRIRLLVSKERRGKTAGMKSLVAGAEGELLAFTDANVVVPADALVNLAAALHDPEVCCASARLLYSNQDETGVSASGAIYWRLEEFIKSLETETVGLVGVDGALFVIARDAYFAPPDELIDDLYVSMCALLTGKRVVSAQSVMVEERGAARWNEEFHRKARIACQAIRVHRALWPRLSKASPQLLYCYLSHRFVKWMTPFNLLAGGIFLTAGLCVAFKSLWPLAGVGGLGLAVVAGALLNLPYFRVLIGAGVSLAGVAYGQLQAVFTRETYSTWTPAATVRDEG
jgi:cellulose synthase/poly-beta-1,6-N-acetylglucosamine synthase-like glycosyltransferase